MAKYTGEQIPHAEWSEIFSINFKCTIESRMRAFQYKILTRTLTTNRYLKFFKIVESDQCYFCKDSIETIEHLLWFCPVVSNFWKDIFSVINNHLEVNIHLNSKAILLGYQGNKYPRLINHIFNIIKRYIYVTKCIERNLNLEIVLKMIKKHQQIEKYIAQNKSNSSYIHIDKWSPILELLHNY